MAHAYGYTIGYTMVLVLAHYTWQHSPEYTGKRGGEAPLGCANLFNALPINPPGEISDRSHSGHTES